MKRAVISVMLVLALVVTVVAAACAAPKPTPTATPRPTLAPTATTAPTPTPGVGPTATPGPTVAPTVGPTVGPTAAPTPTAVPAEGKVFKWTFANVGPPPPGAIQPYVHLSLEELERRSGGRIEVQVLWEGQHPFKNPDLIGAVKDRMVEASYNMVDYISAVEPIVGAMNQPFLLTGGAPEFWWIWDQIRDEAMIQPLAKNWNQMPLFDFILPDLQAFEAKGFIRNAEEAKKLKIRAYGKAQADQFDIMGVPSLVVSWGDVIPGLERGIIDGLAISVAGSYRAKMFDFVKYITRVPGWAYLPSFTGLNLDAFNELPDDLKQVVNDFYFWARDYSANYVIQDDAYYNMQAMINSGAQIASMSPSYIASFRPKMEQTWDKWAASVGPQGPPLLDKIKTLHKQWEAEHK